MQILFVPGRARGDTLLVTDSANNRIRVIDTESGMVTTLTGMSEPGDQDGSWGVARFASPRGIARMNSGVVLVTDNNGIRSLTSAACIKTIACADRNAVYPSDASGELTALTPMACECKAGWYGENGRQCTPCGLGTYKSVVGPTPCLDCPANSNSKVGSTSLEACQCNAGFSGADGGHCWNCDPGQYKATQGSAACTDCPQGQYAFGLAATTCTGQRPGGYSDNLSIFNVYRTVMISAMIVALVFLVIMLVARATRRAARHDLKRSPGARGGAQDVQQGDGDIELSAIGRGTASLLSVFERAAARSSAGMGGGSDDTEARGERSGLPTPVQGRGSSAGMGGGSDDVAEQCAEATVEGFPGLPAPVQGREEQREQNAGTAAAKLAMTTAMAAGMRIGAQKRVQAQGSASAV